MNELIKILLRILPFLVIILVLALNVKRGKISKEDLALLKPNTLTKAIIWCTSFLIFCVLTEVLLFHYHLLEIKPHVFDVKTSMLKIIGMVLLAPIAEELLYRGLFLTKLIQFNVNKHVSIFIIAIVFVLVHSIALEHTLSSNIAFIQIFIDATLFGYARLTTKSIYTPIAMHVIGNLIASAEMYLLW